MLAFITAMNLSRIRLRRAISLAVMVSLTAVGAGHAAGDNGIPDSNGAGLDTHLFRPAMDSKGFFTVNGSDILGKNDVSFGLVIDYGRSLLRVDDKGQKSLQLVNHSFQGTTQFNFGLLNQ